MIRTLRCNMDKMSERVVMIAAVLALSALTVRAENWVRFSSVKMELPAGDKVVRGYSESFYDSDSVRYYDNTRVEIRLKHAAYIGGIEPHTTRELIRIDCMTNSFESLVASPDDPDALKLINKGEIGDGSAYRIIKAAYCGIPIPPH